ncbi:hypothetical protein CR513_53866, partial [Mucuna pruriens]
MIKNKNKSLKIIIIVLHVKSLVYKGFLLYNGKNNVDILLRKQIYIFYEERLGHNPSKQEKVFKSLFVSFNTSSNYFIKCFYYGRKVHIGSTYNIRKNTWKWQENLGA